MATFPGLDSAELVWVAVCKGPLSLLDNGVERLGRFHDFSEGISSSDNRLGFFS